jgi:wyosine [tRNA(Phe)-imidazoG37] synthetase (radical SAM superfamily)
MSGFLFHETVFGPVMSRRLGVSLGVNLLPNDYKYCTFNCIYCECGWTFNKPAGNKGLPGRDEVRSLLEKKLIDMQDDGQAPDAITFAGNGEPTIHPEFPQIIDDTINLRNKYFPETNITVLSNASMLHREDVFNALLKVDNNIQKLDAGTEEVFQLINKPAGKLNLNTIVEQLQRFNGKLIVQTLFLNGNHEGHSIDNTADEEVASWIGLLNKIDPEYVMIYSVDRGTPEENIEKISFEALNHIAVKVNEAGIKTKVFG